jgi:hypothetical protein
VTVGHHNIFGNYHLAAERIGHQILIFIGPIDRQAGVPAALNGTEPIAVSRHIHESQILR